MFGPLPPSPTPVLYVARHGATALNDQDRFRGPLNPPLAPDGRARAAVLADFFVGRPIAGIVHSGKHRSEETAHIVAEKQPPGVWLGADPNLQAWNVGTFAGKPKSEANVSRLEDDYVAHPDLPVPGGESLNAFRGRVHPAIRHALAPYAPTGVPPLLIAHSSVVHELGAMFNGDTKSALVEPGGVSAVFNDGNRLVARALLHPKTEADQGKGGLVS